MDETMKQSSFSRTMYNEGKLGAYFTDKGHCERIGRLFKFPDEVAVLEPSIGDGTAVHAILKDVNASVFGVEMNRETFLEEKETYPNDYVVNADFLKGVKISQRAFSFCFSNPPYGEDEEHERLEKKFVEKMYPYITNDGILALVIPYYVFAEEHFFKSFFSRFTPLKLYKFDDGEYSKFKQIVVVGRAHPLGHRKEDFELAFQAIPKEEEVPRLPQDVEENKKIMVKPSSGEKVVYFTTLKFDAQEAEKYLSASTNYKRIIREGMLPEYRATSIGHPPVPLKKDLLYLCATAGGGQGITGSEENHDLHLQRGVAKVIKTNEILPGKDGGQMVKESSFTKISLNIIENDGRITTLE